MLTPLGISLIDWACCIAAVVTSLYVPYVFQDLQFRVGNPDPLDWIMGTVMIVVLLEATRRSVGWPLPIIAVVLIVYALYGRALPGILAHPGNSWKSVVNHLYLTSQGIYGIALGVVATYVFHYVLFGVLATRVGLGRFFIDLATALTGRFSGGPAKVSIFGSALFGMISGSSIANTVTVGSLTIPAMIRIGYARHFAGAVEAAAATGGQITPPIMGAAAFLMVEYLAVPYQTIILAAIVPGVHAFLRRVLPDSLRGEEARPARPAALRTAGRARRHPPRLADRDAARRAADRAVLRFHALSGGVLGNHRLHRARPHQSQSRRCGRLSPSLSRSASASRS